MTNILPINQIICGDCRDVMRGWPNGIGLILTDPPYGLKLKTDYSKGKFGSHPGTAHRTIINDNEPFDPTHLLRYGSCILWGANNYASKLPDSPAWLSWDKVTRNGLKLRIAEMELAWTNCIRRPQTFRHLWSGAYRASEQRTKFHPSQKPVALMRWCLELVPQAMLVIDPYCGSGSVCIAAKELGLPYIGIEIDAAYCEVTRNRLGQTAKLVA